MYKKKYSPEESLEKIKLFMKYDSKKTLNENKVIVEQLDYRSDSRDIKNEVDKFNSDENKLISIIQKYTTKADFKKLVDTYKEYYDIDLGRAIYEAINDNDDPTESKQFKDHLAKLGVGVKWSTEGGKSSWAFDFGESKPETKTDERQKHINGIFCSVQNGVITNSASKWNGEKWTDYVKRVKVSEQEIQTAKSSCGKTGENKKTITIPSELKDVKAFQDWLDQNAPGWATGYKDGIINKGSNGGGYGTYGPRTSKAWGLYKDKYLNKQTPSTAQDEIGPEEIEINVAEL